MALKLFAKEAGIPQLYPALVIRKTQLMPSVGIQ